MFLEIKFEKPQTSLKDNNKMLHAFIELFQINKTRKLQKNNNDINVSYPAEVRKIWEQIGAVWCFRR